MMVVGGVPLKAHVVYIAIETLSRVVSLRLPAVLTLV
jgi:hypothetical protein